MLRGAVYPRLAQANRAQATPYRGADGQTAALRRGLHGLWMSQIVSRWAHRFHRHRASTQNFGRAARHAQPATSTVPSRALAPRGPTIATTMPMRPTGAGVPGVMMTTRAALTRVPGVAGATISSIHRPATGRARPTGAMPNRRRAGMSRKDPITENAARGPGACADVSRGVVKTASTVPAGAGGGFAGRVREASV